MICLIATLYIYREVLAATETGEVLTNVVKIVNSIKTSSLIPHVSEIFCLGMRSEQSRLFLHTEVPWMSRGRVLEIHFELPKNACFLLNRKSVL
jgi:hypothetical protein